jgi:hypothetical protein
MFVLQELETAIVQCEAATCLTQQCLYNAIHSMEAGVAFYAGSLEGTEGQGAGNLMYDLADEMCIDFKTCGPNGDKTVGTSKVNLNIMDQFRQMQANILSHQCTPARLNKESIAIQMTVPLVQATLKYAYITGRKSDATRVDEAKGAAYASSSIPYAGKCRPGDGQVIWDYMKTGKDWSVDFAQVKDAYERNYHCMKITCYDVGGLWFNGIVSGLYMEGAEPCWYAPPKPLTHGQIVGLVVASLFAVAVSYGLFKACRYFHYFGLCTKLQRRNRQANMNSTEVQRIARGVTA